MKKLESIAVYCASSNKIRPSYVEAAERLGAEFAKHGIRLIYGDGGIGLMAATARGALAEGGEVLGIIPQFMVDAGWNNPRSTHTIVTQTMHERKELMAKMADAVIALPGGCGTMEELLEIITWKQLGLYLNPIIILNVDGYYDPLLEMLQKAVDECFMRPQHLGIWRVAYTPDEAIQMLYTTPAWSKEVRKYAAL